LGLEGSGYGSVQGTRLMESGLLESIHHCANSSKSSYPLLLSCSLFCWFFLISCEIVLPPSMFSCHENTATLFQTCDRYLRGSFNRRPTLQFQAIMSYFPTPLPSSSIILRVEHGIFADIFCLWRLESLNLPYINSLHSGQECETTQPLTERGQNL